MRSVFLLHSLQSHINGICHSGTFSTFPERCRMSFCYIHYSPIRRYMSLCHILYGPEEMVYDIVQHSLQSHIDGMSLCNILYNPKEMFYFIVQHSLQFKRDGLCHTATFAPVLEGWIMSFCNILYSPGEMDYVILLHSLQS